jgi:hypothetical protein
LLTAKVALVICDMQRSAQAGVALSSMLQGTTDVLLLRKI